MERNSMFRMAFALVLTSLLCFTGCLSTEDVDDPVERFEKELIAIEEHIDNSNYFLVGRDSIFGLYYAELAPGTGAKPSIADYIDISYEGSILENGELSANSFDEGDSVVFKLDRLIQGWQILMPYVREGGTVRMFIPSFFGYKDLAINDIPPNSTLVFDVTLNKVANRFDYEQFIIRQYLDQEGIVTKADTVEGLRYEILEEGTGPDIQPGDRIEVNYKGYTLFNDGTYKLREFADQVGAFIDLDSYLSGWRILMPYFKAGSTVKIYLPSKFAYGENGSVSVEPYTPVIYEIEILGN